MNNDSTILRETMVSVVVSVIGSVAGFIAVFGIYGQVRMDELGFDFIPQSFMVVLMCSLVPGLLRGRRFGDRLSMIGLRSLAFAVIAAIIGGGVYLICSAAQNAIMPVATALTIKGIYGGLVAMITTPFSLRAIRPKF
jgi:hypothetical protein